jgi:hypothetical protein
MKTKGRIVFGAFLSSALLCIPLFPHSPVVSANKMTAESLLLRHLEAIGPADARAAIKNRVMIGSSVATFRRRGVSKIEGKAVVASEGRKVLIGMNFGAQDYPHENLAFDGNAITVGYLSPGVRSMLGNFLLAHDTGFRQGLIGGVLSTSWPLLDLTGKDIKLEYAGATKINYLHVHELEYIPRKGSDLRISLFFDASTFRHVRTEYRRTVSAPMGPTPDTSSQQRETRYRMVEDFSEFARQGNLVIPHTYKIELVVESPAGTITSEWLMTFSQYSINQSLEEGSFNVSRG